MEETVKWYDNIVFWSALTGWFVAQTTKLISNFVTKRKVDFRYWVSTGGMPSAHSAMASALATSVGLREGFQSSLFAVATAFAIVVMFDAQTVRRAAGMQARLLNQIVTEVFKEHHFPQKKMAELLGHTPLEVFAGLIVGVLVGVIFHWNFGV